MEDSLCTSLLVNLCSPPVLRPLARSTACGDTHQQWLTPAQACLTKQFTLSKEKGKAILY
jgi:hypothetical protein